MIYDKHRLIKIIDDATEKKEKGKPRISRKTDMRKKAERKEGRVYWEKNLKRPPGHQFNSIWPKSVREYWHLVRLGVSQLVS